MGKVVLVSPWFWCSGVLPFTFVYGYVHMARIVLVSLWFWCSCSLPCALVYEYCLWARFALVSCGPGALRVSVRIRPMGKGLLLRGPGAQRELRALVYGIALVSP